ncbi:MAG: hypothetical protein SH819_13975 [Cytophagales bacterium]|nr:hypothetical protein [Cytophagales bacterium]
MRPVFILCLLVSTLLATLAQAQSPATSREPGKQRAFHAPHRATSTNQRKQKVKHNAQYQFYKRVEMAAREKQRILKQLAKPQFSDHRHFGHKRIPKRRPAHKIRYCNECGIRH